MDAATVGKRVAELRKEQGLTQKELAAKLHITDGAVSKWERGINFPDLALIEPLAAALNTNVIQLLSLEGATKNEVASAMSGISMIERERLIKDLKKMARRNIMNGLILLACLSTASIIFRDHNIFGLAQGVTMGAMGFVGTIIGSEIYLIRNINKV